MENRSHFDYIIIGNGLAGLQLAMAMASDVFFKKKQIALIDPSEKNTNDKTWSFWETSPSKWDQIVHKSWKEASIFTSKKNINLRLSPYIYKSIRAIDFYRYAKKTLKAHQNFHFIADAVVSISNAAAPLVISTKTDTFKARHVFDSRIPDAFYNSKKAITLIQHFKGIVIKTASESFDEGKVTMMDYRLKDGAQTTFTYVLPFSKKQALIEFTYFTEYMVSEQTYDTFIGKYISDHLKIEHYSILESESGSIPMTTFPFEKLNNEHITKIGTAGGWVKASSGYAFKHTEKKVAKIIGNIKSDRIPSQRLFKKRFRFYDKVFLRVLKDENHKGEWLFQEFFSKNDTRTMFRFLDEDSSFYEELKVMKSLFSWSFIKAFFKILWP